MMIPARSATITDHTPPTPASEVAPHSGNAKNDASMRGKTIIDMEMLTATATTSGNAARQMAGCSAAAAPLPISAGSKSRAVLARSRIKSSAAARFGSVPPPTP